MNEGLPVCLASDYNPGSFHRNMNLVLLACIQMKMNPEEHNAATINGAYAMGISKSEGSIAKVKKEMFSSQNKYHPMHSYHITWT